MKILLVLLLSWTFLIAHGHGQFNCGQCGNKSGIACISPTEFNVCENGFPDSSHTFSCKHGLVCDITAAAPNFCTDPAVAMVPVCTPVITTTPTTFIRVTTFAATSTTTNNPQDWCSNNGSVGRFADDSDTTCKAYYNCFTKNNDLTGQYLKCVGTTVFNPNLNQCVDPDTYDCGN